MILGVFWITFGAFIIWENPEFRWYNLLYILVGMLYSAQFIYDVAFQYMSINEVYLRKNSLFVKKILLKDIIAIKKFTGGYTVKTNQKELTIKSHLIDKKSLTQLESFLDTFEIVGNKYYELKL